MPDAPAIHAMTPDRRQMSQMVHQHTANLRQTQCAQPVVCAVSNSATEKHDFNRGEIVNSTMPTFMHTASTEVSVMTMSCTQCNLLDQEAVEAVSRQHETVISAAADTEVPLPCALAQDPDQASTAAPADDEQDLFAREEAFRMDDEIMDFQWFDNIPWDSIKDLRGTTQIQPPTRFKFALQQAQHAILRAIMHNNPSSLASEPAWKASVLRSWLLLRRPAVNASESNCAHYLDARLDLFWAEDWPALWATVRAECDVAPFHSATRRTTTEQKHARIRKGATHARSGEKGRALAAARNAPPVPVTEQIVQEIKSPYPTDPEPPAANGLISTTLRKMPRLSEPGPLVL